MTLPLMATLNSLDGLNHYEEEKEHGEGCKGD